jgi:hypothetical protein
MLSEDGIRLTLNAIIQDIRQGKIENAQATLEVLNFERLLRPIPDTSKGPGQRLYIDPAGPFGIERVHEVADHLRKCRAALISQDANAALEAAQKALHRWQEG